MKSNSKETAMKDFGRWFNDFVLQPVEQPEPVQVELPDGVEEIEHGRYTAMCCVCLRTDVLLFDIGLLPQKGYVHYCYRDAGCCP